MERGKGERKEMRRGSEKESQQEGETEESLTIFLTLSTKNILHLTHTFKLLLVNICKITEICFSDFIMQMFFLPYVCGLRQLKMLLEVGSLLLNCSYK